MTVYVFKTDEELVESIKQGEITAFEELVRRFEQKLVIFAVRIVGSGPEAEDIVTRALFKIYQTIERVDTRQKFSSYAYRIVKNDAISYLRGRRNNLPLEELEIIDEDEDVYERLSRKDEAETVRKAVDKLGVKYKQVIKLYYFGDLSYEEIGAKLKMPVNTVRTHLRRAKELLKKSL